MDHYYSLHNTFKNRILNYLKYRIVSLIINGFPVEIYFLNEREIEKGYRNWYKRSFKYNIID